VTSDEMLAMLAARGNSENLAGMARYAINTARAFGVSVTELRRIAKAVGTDHRLALELWATGNHEAQLLAGMIDDPALVDEAQLERWAADLDSWDTCDQTCANLFDRTDFARLKAVEWAAREEEFVKRAAFVLMAALAVHDKQAPDEVFARFLPVIAAAADDERNFVKKAVNWALRTIGKRNQALNAAAVVCSRQIAAQGTRSARWIAADALRELTSAKVQQRLTK
jgi:3-methyladenine DNA glycosylase AlkD